MSDNDINQRVTEEHNKQIKTKFIKELSDSTPFMLAFHHEKCSLEIIESLIKFGIDINCQDCNGNNIIHIAAMKGHLNIIK